MPQPAATPSPCGPTRQGRTPGLAPAGFFFFGAAPGAVASGPERFPGFAVVVPALEPADFLQGGGFDQFRDGGISLKVPGGREGRPDLVGVGRREVGCRSAASADASAHRAPARGSVCSSKAAGAAAIPSGTGCVGSGHPGGRPPGPAPRWAGLTLALA